MREITVLVHESDIPEFYRRLGELMAESEDDPDSADKEQHNHRDPLGSNRTAPEWIEESNAEQRAELLWSTLSENARNTFNVLIDGALAEQPQRFTSEELAEAAGIPNGPSGVAGVFGAAGRAIRKVGLPLYDTGKPLQWHYVWDWDGTRYWMVPKVAEVFRQVR